MSYQVPYQPAVDAIAALAAIVSDDPDQPGSAVVAGRDPLVADTESWPDIYRGQAVLHELIRASAAYTEQATHANAVFTAQAAAITQYNTELAAYNSQLAQQWGFLDASVRTATEELIAIGDTSQAWSTAATTPTNDVPAIVIRCRVAAEACAKHETLTAVGKALLDAVHNLEGHATPPVLRTFPDPSPPSTTNLDRLVAKANQFTAYLQDS